MLIAVEDEKSARRYFESFREALQAHRVVVIAEHLGSDPGSVVSAAKRENEARNKMATDEEADPFDEVWVVFDTEGPQNSQRLAKAKNAIDQAEQLGFYHAVSNPCFEFWVLLHFEWCVDMFAECKEVVKRVRKHISGYDKSYNPFDDTRIYVKVAIERAEQVFNERHAYSSQHPCDCHPSTGVHKLVESLLGNA